MSRGERARSGSRGGDREGSFVGDFGGECADVAELIGLFSAIQGGEWGCEMVPVAVFISAELGGNASFGDWRAPISTMNTEARSGAGLSWLARTLMQKTLNAKVPCIPGAASVRYVEAS
jgi:hypothetical protein